MVLACARTISPPTSWERRWSRHDRAYRLRRRDLPSRRHRVVRPLLWRTRGSAGVLSLSPPFGGKGLCGTSARKVTRRAGTCLASPCGLREPSVVESPMAGPAAVGPQRPSANHTVYPDFGPHPCGRCLHPFRKSAHDRTEACAPAEPTPGSTSGESPCHTSPPGRIAVPLRRVRL